jgi:hypothetical protein
MQETILKNVCQYRSHPVQSVQSSSSCKVRESISGIYEATGDYRGLQRMEKKKERDTRSNLKKQLHYLKRLIVLAWKVMSHPSNDNFKVFFGFIFTKFCIRPYDKIKINKYMDIYFRSKYIK